MDFIGIFNIFLGIVFLGLLFLQGFALMWGPTGETMGSASAELIQKILYWLFLLHPIWSFFCLFNYVWPQWLDISRYIWFVAGFTPILLAFLMFGLGSILSKFE